MTPDVVFWNPSHATLDILPAGSTRTAISVTRDDYEGKKPPKFFNRNEVISVMGPNTFTLNDGVSLTTADAKVYNAAIESQPDSSQQSL